MLLMIGNQQRSSLLKVGSLFLLIGMILSSISVIAATSSITMSTLSPAEKKVQGDEWVKRNSSGVELYGNNLLYSLDTPAVLLVLEDIPTLSLWSLHQQGEIPPSLYIYDFDGNFFYALPGFSGMTATSNTLDQLFRSREALEREFILKSQIPVYSTARRDTRDLPGYDLLPCGMVYLFHKQGTPVPDYAKHISRIQMFAQDSKANLSAEQKNMAAIMHYMRAVNYLQLRTAWAKDSARNDFMESAKWSIDLKGIHILLAENFIKLSDKNNALSSAQTAVLKRPDSAKAFFLLGQAWEMNKASLKAVDAYQQSMKLDPGNSQLHYRLGMLFETLKKNKEAREIYHQSLQSNPSSPESGAIKKRLQSLSK